MKESTVEIDGTIIGQLFEGNPEATFTTINVEFTRGISVGQLKFSGRHSLISMP